MKIKTFFLSLIIAFAAVSTVFTTTSKAQVEPMTMSFGFDAGLTKYWGDFTDNQFFWGGDLFLRWNISPVFSLHGMYNMGQVRYKINSEVISKYQSYFGSTSTLGSLYPGTEIKINDKNAINYYSFDLLGSINLFPSQKFVPYLFGGVGYMNFQPKSGDTGFDGPLPNNLKGVYERNKIVFPVGIGFELYVTNNFVINGKAMYRLGMSEYFDDLSMKEDPKASDKADQLLQFGLGVSYYIFGNTDYDKDGLPNDQEATIGTDPRNPDTDGDGLKDGEEVNTYGTNPLKADSDDDGLNDYDELMTYKTVPTKADSDGDGLKDGDEIARKTFPLVVDSDGDGLNDGDEINTHKTDPLNIDSDGDGLKDGDEIAKFSTNPLKLDTDEDGLSDGEEANVYSTNPTIKDTDGDGLLDGIEISQYKTNPLKADSDGDGLNDGEEINNYKTDPLKSDTDNDLATDFQEIKNLRTNPLDPDTDKDNVLDGKDDCPLIKGVESTEKGRNGCPAPPKIGTKTDFPEILFIVNTDEFNFEMPSTSENLAKLLAYVNQCDGIQVRIEGHASEEGKASRNMELSDLRAKKVKNWLIERGVNANKIATTVGYGSTQPKFKEPKGKELKKYTKDQLENLRKQNRRITVVVVKTCS